MAVSKDFIEAVEQKKITKVRIMMKDNLLIDTSFKSFDEMLDYAQKSIPELVVAHDGETSKPQPDWDEDYLNEQMVAVVNNFSNERINLLKKMIKNSEEDKNVQTEQRTSNGQESFSSTRIESKGDSGSTKVIGGCIAGAGAIALIAGLAISNAPVVVPIAGGIAIGVGAYLFFRKK